MSKPANVANRASVRDCDEKEIVVEESVGALGFGFLHLPPTRYAPLVIKTVKQDSWADQQGIIPGSELLELNGQEAGRLGSDEFRETLKQRPLRMKLAPPHGEVWKQVAAFQQQVVALSLQKVHLQQALKDESDRVMRELGICTELEKSNSMQHKAKLLKDQTQRMQEKQVLQEELEKLKAELETCHLHMAAEQQQMDVERSKWQAEVQTSAARLAENASERSAMEEQMKELQAQLASNVVQLDSERQLRRSLEEEKLKLQATCTEAEARVQRCKVELEAAQKGSLEAEEMEMARINRSRASLEEERQQLAAQQAEVQAEKSRTAAERLELEDLLALRNKPKEKDPELEEAQKELSKLRLTLTSVQPELQMLVAELATAELFKVESSAPAAPPAPAPPALPGSSPNRRSYARRSLPLVQAPPEDKESDEEMF